MKIAQKLLLILLATSLLPLLLIGIFTYSNTQRALTEQIHIRLGNIAAYQAKAVETVEALARSRLLIIANGAQIRLALDQYNKAGGLDLRAQLSQNLTELKRDVPSFERIHALNLRGIIVASTDPRYLGNDLSQTEVFKVGQKEPTSSVLFKDLEGVMRQHLGAPLRLDGKPIGVVVVENQAEALLNITSDYSQLGTTGESYLVQRQSNGSLTYLTPLRFKPNAALTPAGRDFTPDTDYRGHKVLSIHQEVANNWVLVAKIDAAEVNAPLLAQRNLAVASIVVLAILVALIAWYFARLVTNPIRLLTSVATSIHQGHWDQRVPVKSRDEIGVLGTVFNEMTSQLISYSQSLEAKITERTAQLRQKVQEVEQAKAKDDAIIDSMGEGMVVTDSQGGVLLVNEIAVTLLNLTEEQANNLDLKTYPFYDDKGVQIPFEQTPLAQVLQLQAKIKQDVSADQPNGAKRVINVVASPVMQNGMLIGSIQIIRDITKEREVDRMKTEFISLASHQLRTPLSAIKWFSEMLNNGDAGELKPEQQEFAKNISDSANRMVDLVNSLLNISRIESGRIIVDPKPTDLKELITGIVNDVKAKTEERQQTLLISVHKDLPKINLDPHLIGQVYMNLLTNAIKYTPKGGEITVFISRKGDDVISQVTDNGYGIPKSQQSRIFQKFFRAENIIKVEADGTGLGLYLIKAIVESSGGKIWFDSEDGKGTTFWFTLPMSGMKAKAGEVTLDPGRGVAT